MTWGEVESGCNGRLLGNSGRKGGCNATQDAQDAQDAKTTSPRSGRNDDASDVGNILADVLVIPAGRLRPAQNSPSYIFRIGALVAQLPSSVGRRLGVKGEIAFTLCQRLSAEGPQ